MMTDDDDDDDDDESVTEVQAPQAPKSPRMDRGDDAEEAGEATLVSAATEQKLYEIDLTDAESRYYDAMCDLQGMGTEFALVGAGIGGGFENTKELKVMKYDEAMSGPDKPHWERAAYEEYLRMLKHKVWVAIQRCKVPKWAKILTSTWACKKKSNGVYRARLNARGFEQVDGMHYIKSDKSAPVVGMVSVMIILTLITMMNWYACLVDVHGAFLLGNFEPGVEMYMEVPQGFEKYYPGDVVLKLLKTIYGTIQAAKRFWIFLLSVLRKFAFERSKADPCVYYKWKNGRLLIVASWVDDLLLCGNKADVLELKKQLFDTMECEDVGELNEYVGCKIERTEDAIKLTQPVLIQSFKDEFEVPKSMSGVDTPATAGQVLHRGTEDTNVDPAMQTKYRSGVGKLIHLMRWSRVEIANSVRELTRMFSGASLAHVKAMYRTMAYCMNTHMRGRVLKPNRKCDENNLKDFEFEIAGMPDSNYANDPETRRSVTGYSVFLEGSPTSTRSRMQQSVTMSVTEAEYVAAADCAMDMLFQMRLLESIGLKVKKPMKIHSDNKGAMDLANSWSASGRTKHIDTRHHFLRELKEEGVLTFIWTSRDENSSDIFTHNVGSAEFNKHIVPYCGVDEHHPSSKDA